MIGVVTGFKAEAALLPAGVRVLCSGGRALLARQRAEELLAEGAGGLLSFGVAGGLVDGWGPGGLVVAGGVVLASGEVLCCAPWWTAALLDGLPDALGGLVVAGSEVVATTAAKQGLRQRSGALAVDLESGAVAEVCRAAGKPFAVLRAIADPVERGIPPIALAALNEAGGLRLGAVLCGLALRPWALGSLLRLGLDSRAGLRALAVAAERLGATLGFETM
jgi:hopanoid-associated phosphorylase